jgi:hypothetical protein
MGALRPRRFQGKENPMREFKGNWQDLFFGFRIALDLRKIFLAFVGAIFTAVGLFIILGFGAGFQFGADFTDCLAEFEVGDAVRLVKEWTYATYYMPVRNLALHPANLLHWLVPRESKAWVRHGWPQVILPELILLASVLWLIFIWSRFGGAITRVAAVEIAKDERITTNEAMEYSKKKFSSYFWSPLSVLIAFLFFYLVNALGGLITRIPYAGPILVALLAILAFLSAFVALLIAIGGSFGWPLMSPAISAEGTDAFDAVSRAFSYVYSRPWQYAFYWLVSGAYGIACVGFVWLFTLALTYVAFSSAQLGAGASLDGPVRAIFGFLQQSPFDGMNACQAILTVILGTFVVLLFGLGGSYAVSFCYTQRTLMYFVLRKRVDNTEMTEVYMEEEEEDLFEEEKGEGAEEPREAGGEKKETGEKKEGGGACAEEKPKPESGEKKTEAKPPEGQDKPPSAGPQAAEPPKP